MPSERNVGGRAQLAQHLYNHYYKLETAKPTIKLPAADRPQPRTPSALPSVTSLTAEQRFQKTRCLSAVEPLYNGMTVGQWKNIRSYLVAQSGAKRNKSRSQTTDHYLNLRAMYRKINSISRRKNAHTKPPGTYASRSVHTSMRRQPPPSPEYEEEVEQPSQYAEDEQSGEEQVEVPEEEPEEEAMAESKAQAELPDEEEVREHVPVLTSASEEHRNAFKEDLLQLIFNFELFNEGSLRRLFELAELKNPRWKPGLIAGLCQEAEVFLYEQYEALQKEEEEE